MPETVGPLLKLVFEDWWKHYNDDTEPGNAEKRALITSLVEEAAKMPATKALDRRRGWRIIDWICRVHFADALDLASYTDRAARVRASPEIVDLPGVPGAFAALRSSFHFIDREDTRCMRCMPGFRTIAEERKNPRLSAVREGNGLNLQFAIWMVSQPVLHTNWFEKPRPPTPGYLSDLRGAVDRVMHTMRDGEYGPIMCERLAAANKSIPMSALRRYAEESDRSQMALLRELIAMKPVHERRAA